MGQEPSKDDAIAGENHEAIHSVVVGNERCEDSAVRNVSQHGLKEEEAVGVEEAEEPHMDLIDRKNRANLPALSDTSEDRKISDQVLLSTANPSGKEDCVPNPSRNGIEGSSREAIAASQATDAAKTPGVVPKQKMATPYPKDTKIVIGDAEPAKRSTRAKFVSGGLVGGLLLGPFGFLLILWTPVRNKFENVLLVSIGVLFAIMVWIVIVAISVGVTLKS